MYPIIVFMKCSYLPLVFLFSCATALASTSLLSENWESGTTDQWNLWGSPLPVLNASSGAIGDYSIDPNGDGSYHSGLVSKQLFSLSENTRLILDAYIESASAWSELEFGLIDTNSVPSNPNTGLYSIATVLIDADTQNSGYKLYANVSGDGGSQTILKNEIASDYFNAWHRFTFDFEADGSISIAIDDALVFDSNSGIFNYSTQSDFAIMLAGRSYSSSDNLYDTIDLVLVPEFSYASSVLGSFVLVLALVRRFKVKNRT